MSFVSFINQNIMQAAASIRYTVNDNAPQTFADLKQASSLVVWAGACENTVFQCPHVNRAFRAIHDVAHLKHNLDFSHDHEMELGRIQASKQNSDIMRELVFAEVVLGAKHHKDTGLFAIGPDLTLTHLKALKLIK